MLPSCPTATAGRESGAGSVVIDVSHPEIEIGVVVWVGLAGAGVYDGVDVPVGIVVCVTVAIGVLLGVTVLVPATEIDIWVWLRSCVLPWITVALPVMRLPVPIRRPARPART
jgi:hypothetical protein